MLTMRSSPFTFARAKEQTSRLCAGLLIRTCCLKEILQIKSKCVKSHELDSEFTSSPQIGNHNLKSMHLNHSTRCVSHIPIRSHDSRFFVILTSSDIYLARGCQLGNIRQNYLGNILRSLYQFPSILS